MSAYESFTSADPAEIRKKEEDLIAKGLRLQAGTAWRKPEPGTYVKSESSGSEESFSGAGKTTLTWLK